ncbi:MAG: hypothetical protein ABR596_00545 [Halarsenatibacteraceae bacterium]
MIKKLGLLIVILSLISVVSIDVRAENNTLQPITSAEAIARSYGMGGAFTAVSDDASALIFNPAGLYQSGKIGFIVSGGMVADNVFQYGELADSINKFSEDAEKPHEFLYNLPEELNLTGQGLLGFKLGSAGAGGNFQARLVGDKDSSGATYKYQLLQDGRLGLSGDIFTIPAEVGIASYGLNIRYQRLTRGEYELVMNDDNDDAPLQREWQATDSGLAVDGGLMLQMTPLVKLGVMIENLWAADLDLAANQRIYKYDENEGWGSPEENYRQEEYSPARSSRVGLSARLPVIGTTLSADIDNFPILTEDKAGDPILYLGFENDMLLSLITVRGGTYKEADGERVLTAGFGVNFAGGSADVGAGFAPGGNRSSIQGAVSLDL